MEIDSRLNEIDDCLYRVATRALIVQNSRVLLVKEKDGDWWALPGGGVAHGESIETALTREIEEELGISADWAIFDPQIVFHNIGKVVNGVPRMNLFFKAIIPENQLQETDHVSEWRWFTEDEFMNANLHASYDKAELARVVF